jgi:hypothetical protein
VGTPPVWRVARANAFPPAAKFTGEGRLVDRCQPRVSWWGGRSGGTETTRIMTPVGIGDMHLV